MTRLQKRLSYLEDGLGQEIQEIKDNNLPKMNEFAEKNREDVRNLILIGEMKNKYANNSSFLEYEPFIWTDNIGDYCSHNKLNFEEMKQLFEQYILYIIEESDRNINDEFESTLKWLDFIIDDNIYNASLVTEYKEEVITKMKMLNIESNRCINLEKRLTYKINDILKTAFNSVIYESISDIEALSTDWNIPKDKVEIMVNSIIKNNETQKKIIDLILKLQTNYNTPEDLKEMLIRSLSEVIDIKTAEEKATEVVWQIPFERKKEIFYYLTKRFKKNIRFSMPTIESVMEEYFVEKEEAQKIIDSYISTEWIN
jgi:hypothetical protein